VGRAGDAGRTAAIPAIGTSPQAVRRALRELHGCVPLLSAHARSLLRQRAGFGRVEPRSLGALSVSLRISRAAVLERLRRAVGELRTVAQTTGCAGTSIATNPLTGSSTLFGDGGGAPAADRSAVLGVSAHGGPASQGGSAPGSGTARRPAAGTAGPGTALMVALVLLMLALVGAGGLASRRVGPFRRPRPRRTVTPRWYSLAMRAGFRYSELRDALVLPGIGERFGPVLVRDGERGRRRTARAPLESGRDGAEVRASRRAPAGRREGRQARRHAGPRR
jgi:hypothetical protein